MHYLLQSINLKQLQIYNDNWQKFSILTAENNLVLIHNLI